MSKREFTPEEIAKSLKVCCTPKPDRGFIPRIDCGSCGFKRSPGTCRWDLQRAAAYMIENQAERIKQLAGQLILKNDELLKLREENRWIPVGERLPDTNEPVLVFCENVTIQGGYTVHIGSCDKAAESHFWFLRTQPGVSSFPNHEWKVTHWKPMPKGSDA